MSRLADTLTVPDTITIAPEREQAWQWMEEQGFGSTDADGGYILTPYAGDSEYVAVFGAQPSDGWIPEGAPGHEQLLMLGTVSGSGSLLALWRTDDGAQRYVVLRDMGPSSCAVIADSPVDLMRFIGIGYDELTPWSLGAEPEDEEGVEALAPFRAWVEDTFGVSVPEQWDGIDDGGAFVAWLESKLG